MGPDLTVVWHAGEPLVVPLPFYEEAFQIFDMLTPSACRVSHSIQTNGTLLTQEWCDFIADRRVQLGLSIDGPAFLHDRQRMTRAKGGTHARVMRGVELLQRNGIPFHVIVVLTRHSLDYPDEVFDFFVTHGIRQIGFNIDEQEGQNRSSLTASSEGEAAYRRFMRRIYQRAKVSNGQLRVREFERAGRIIASEADEASEQVVPFGILSVDSDGNISTFSPELLGQKNSGYGDFVFGNIWQEGVAVLSDNAWFRKVHREIADGVESCQSSCEYFRLCGGGAPANKLFENGSFRSAETVYCRCSVQVPIDIVLEDLERSLGLSTIAQARKATG